MSALRHTVTGPDDDLFLRTVADDTEDAPWMVMNDRQFWNASGLAWSLRTYAEARGLDWYVGGMLPLLFRPAGAPRRKQVAPDVFVAFVADHSRESLNIDDEGMPPFVLEAVSSSSVRRDLQEKDSIYRILGVEEYAIVRLDLPSPRLEGYRRDATGAWGRWSTDEQGRLWSAVLGLWLLMQGEEVQAMTPEGELLLSPRQEAQARQQDAQARQQAEQEVARLRAELERLARREDAPHDGA